MPYLKYQLSNFFKHKCAVWEFTLKCNSRCIHCGSSAGKLRSNELNTGEAIALVKDLKSCGFDGIALMGGEPFLREDWYDVAREVKRNKMKLTIVSNGLEIKSKIPELKKLKIDCVSLSLDGATARTHDYIRGISGALNKVLRSMDLLLKANISVSVITTVSKINIKELPMIRDLLLNRRIAWQIQIALPIGRFPMNLMISREEFYGIAMFIALNCKMYSIRELPIIGAHCFGYFSLMLPEIGLEPWIGCQAGKSVLGIQSNGNIKGCLTLSDEFIEGNIRNKKLSDIINHRFNLKCNNYIRKLDVNDYCYSCKMFKKCEGGCLGTKIALNIPDTPFCLRAIEEDLFKKHSLPFRFKIHSKLSKFKFLYEKILLK